MNNLIVNIRFGRHFWQVYYDPNMRRYVSRWLTMTDGWVAKFGVRPWVKVWTLFGYQPAEKKKMDADDKLEFDIVFEESAE